MSEIFGKHRELRFLDRCANYDMETYSDSVSFYFKNRNPNNLLKGLSIKYCN